MERIAPIKPPYPPNLQAAFEATAGGRPPRIYRVAANSETTFNALFGSGLISPLGLFATPNQPQKLRELVILRTCFRMRAGYEWGLHIALLAKSSGLTDTQNQATAKAEVDANLWTAEEQALIALVDSITTGQGVSDALYATLMKHFSAAMMIEWVQLISFYQGVGNLCALSQVEYDPYSPKMPA
jgi:alkylhydroperoxidase family enzyme